MGSTEHDPRTLQMRPRCIATTGLLDLIKVLRSDGYMVIGPIFRDGAIVYDEITEPTDIAQGWQVETGPGQYAAHTSGGAFFDTVVGPTPWKRFLHPPRETLYRMTKAPDGSVSVQGPDDPVQPLAFLGVRACDLAAISVLDRVLMEGPHPDPRYGARRRNTLIIAVNCRVSAETCFCASMGTGPAATAGYDLCLSELGTGGETRFLVEVGSSEGSDLLAQVSTRAATPEDLSEAADGARVAARQQTRGMTTDGLPDKVVAAHDHPRWADVAHRCLNCTNCTMVCPTCFCTTVEEVSDLAGESFARQQRWDSCFTADFSYIHGGAVRPSAKSRYRQWLTHKLGTWPSQFDGDLGCTGCGRCIAWCPVGIDLTEEIAHLTEEVSP